MEEIIISQELKYLFYDTSLMAARFDHRVLGVEHLVLTLLEEKEEGNPCFMFFEERLDLEHFRSFLQVTTLGIKKLEKMEDDQSFSPLLFEATQGALMEAYKAGVNEILPAHVLLAILKQKTNGVISALKRLLNPAKFERFLQEAELIFPALDIFYITDIRGNYILNPEFKFMDDDDDDDENPVFGASFLKAAERRASGKGTPILDNHSKDLTAAAEMGKLDAIVGREKEIERVIKILSRFKKNNPILIGEPGVGKSSIAEGLAVHIFEKKVPAILLKKRIVSLDVASLVAGTKYRGQFEERIKSILNELDRNKDVILFIDEIHTIIGAGGAGGSLDISNILKPALARGEMQCIGATTLDEYRKYIEKDGALERRFQKVIVEPSTEEETLFILNNISQRYEKYHHVVFEKDALEACVYLSQKYIKDRFLPDKAIDIMDEAGARAQMMRVETSPEIKAIQEEIDQTNLQKQTVIRQQQYELAASLRDQVRILEGKLFKKQTEWEERNRKNPKKIELADIEAVVAHMTGIPVQKLNQDQRLRIMQLENHLNHHVIGQKEAIASVVKAIKRAKSGIKNPNRPIGSFIFLGSTGVGKTELAKQLAIELFGNAEAMIKIDMSEYMEKFNVSRLIGAPPGYVGYEEGGLLTEKVRRKPYSLVLLDEIEKAHPDVFNLLLQVLDEGTITDSLGNKIDFRNTIIIMTSNVGLKKFNDFGHGIGFSLGNVQKMEDQKKEILKEALKKNFAAEFINRIDEIVLFNDLKEENIAQILDLEIEIFAKRLNQKNIVLQIDEKVKKFILSKGFDVKFGARYLNKAIQEYLENAVAEQILQKEMDGNYNCWVHMDENEKIIVHLQDIDNKD